MNPASHFQQSSSSGRNKGTEPNGSPKPLIAPMVAHAVWNTLAFTGIHLIYG
jgi:hypothetical protein